LKRSSYRFPLTVPVRYETQAGEGEGEATLADSSRGGFSVRGASLPLSPGAKGSIRFPFAPEPMAFEVVRSDGDTFASRFVELGTEAEIAFAKRLAQALRDQRG
jgi:hypothetical protein